MAHGFIHLDLSEEEFQVVQVRAQDAGMTVYNYLRTLLELPIVSPITGEKEPVTKKPAPKAKDEPKPPKVERKVAPPKRTDPAPE